MHGIATTLRSALAFWLLAAIGCESASTIGVSREPHPQTPPEPTDAVPRPKPRAPTAIVAARDEELYFALPGLGDLDGDGFDDFILDANRSRGKESVQYLFYGRADFPSKLLSSDADAVFEAFWSLGGRLGDINGDGLADFSLSRRDGFELILGDRVRKTGQRRAFSTGLGWMGATEVDQALDEPLYLSQMRAVGDVDGDGADEFIMSVTVPVPPEQFLTRGGLLATDYLIAGRRDSWPSGVWDPSWASAHFGDEPLAPEDDPATTMIQRLAFLGSGDLDGDGFADVLMHGRLGVWIFYGSAAGMRGELTTEHAAAQFVLEHAMQSSMFEWDAPMERWMFHGGQPFVIGDVDGDGTSDLAFARERQLCIAYGSKTRWQGRVQLEPDLTIEGPGVIIYAAASDIHGSGVPELLIMLNETPTTGPAEMFPKAAAYAVRAATMDTRMTGRYRLQSKDLYRPLGERTPAASSLSFLQELVGDVDGDGSLELLVGAAEEQAAEGSSGVVYLIPGTAATPE